MTEFGFSSEAFGEEEEKLLKRNYFMYTDGVMKLQPGGWVLPAHFNKYSGLIHDFEIKPSDICVYTFPKSGTTWTLEIVWNLIHNPNLGNPDANISPDVRFPNLEADMFLATTDAPCLDPDGEWLKEYKKQNPELQDLDLDGLFIRSAANYPSPRILKCHLPISFLPPNGLDTCKVIYVMRDPRDVAISMYCFAKLQKMWGFRGTLDEFLDDFIEDRAIFGPYWNHVKDAWNKRDHPNMCFVYYENLKNDTFSEIKKIDRFIQTNRNDDQIRNVVDHTSFSLMKERNKDNPPSSNDYIYYNKEAEKELGGFFRKGHTGDWKVSFSPEQQEKLNSWMNKNLEYFGSDFKYKM